MTETRVPMAARSPLRRYSARVAPATCVALGVIVALCAFPAFHSGPSLSAVSSTPGFPVKCGMPDPVPGTTYYAEYNTTTGAIVGLAGYSTSGSSNSSGGSSTGTSAVPLLGSAANGTAVLEIGNTPANASLIHSMFCYAAQGHSGAYPFSVDLATKTVVWDS